MPLSYLCLFHAPTDKKKKNIHNTTQEEREEILVTIMQFGKYFHNAPTGL